MTRWNLPPGCNVSDLPGNTREDEAWAHYWEETERPELVWLGVNLNEPMPDDLFDAYDSDKDYARAIDKDFEKWMDGMYSALDKITQDCREPVDE
jgi:hypothetical protein